MTKRLARALIALGGNLPLGELQPRDTLVGAINALEESGLKVSKISRFFTTPCFPKGSGPDYVNAAISLETERTAPEILTQLHRVENMFSRVREQRWGMRTLDLDLLAVEDQILPDVTVFNEWLKLPQKEQVLRAPGQLILPHPRIQDRGFVLIPLQDIAPDWVHPVLKLNVNEMVARLSDAEIAEIAPI